MSTSTELVSPKEFGAALGVSRQAVMKAIESGRLKECLSRNDRGWWRIDPERGRQEWEAWTDHAKAQGGHASKNGGRPRGAQTRTRATSGLFPEDEEAARHRVTHARASADRIMVDAELKRLELETRRGILIDRHEVQREAFQLARQVRDRVLMIPDRIAAELAGFDDPGDVHRRLLEELLQSLAALTEDVAAHDQEEDLTG